jgi:hypothetical protein
MRRTALYTTAAAALAFVLGLPLAILLLLDPAFSAACPSAGQPTGPGPRTVSGVPSNYLPFYEGAAQYFQLGPNGWAYLAALNYAESNFGQDNGPGTGVLSGSNYAGAAGPMQIGIGGAASDGWDQYKSQIPPNLPGAAEPPSVYNEADAVYVGAAMLKAAGAPGDWAAALKAWNDYPPEWAQVYQLVAQYTHTSQGTGGAASVSSSLSAVTSPQCASSGFGPAGIGRDPIPGFTIGRDDMGVDGDAPAGTPIYAPADSQLVRVLQDWYAGQPLLLFKFTTPLPGALSQYWYLAEEVSPVTETVGTKFGARQVVARFAPSGTGIEIGWGSPTSNSRTLAGETDPGAAHPPAGSTTVWGESFKRFFGIH